MLSRRYTVIVADRSRGTVRRFTVSARPALLAIIFAIGLPVLAGLGLRWSSDAEVYFLRAANHQLQTANLAFRSAATEMTSQLSSLQTILEQLSGRVELDPELQVAIDRLPAGVREYAMGGGINGVWEDSVLLGVEPPINSFDVLQALLGSLESRLHAVRSVVERRDALASATPSIWPALGWMASAFGLRADPITGQPQQHPGLDISGNNGEGVRATADGLVQSASYHPAYGNMVIVSHGFGLTTRYAHLARFAVTTGARVARGDVIGFVGATGRTTGPHLHYEIWINDKPVNPLRFLVAKPAD